MIITIRKKQRENGTKKKNFKVIHNLVIKKKIHKCEGGTILTLSLYHQRQQ